MNTQTQAKHVARHPKRGWFRAYVLGAHFSPRKANPLRIRQKVGISSGRLYASFAHGGARYAITFTISPDRLRTTRKLTSYGRKWERYDLRDPSHSYPDARYCEAWAARHAWDSRRVGGAV